MKTVYVRVMRRPIGLLWLLALAACDRAPSSEGLPEWKPTDHDRLADQQAQRRTPPMPRAPDSADADGGTSANAGSSDAGGGMSAEALADVAWTSLCVTCHGPQGRGDGPQGPMMRPPDFSDKAWHAAHPDAELADAIRNGKNKMPQFGLPDRTIEALVHRVRSFAR